MSSSKKKEEEHLLKDLKTDYKTNEFRFKQIDKSCCFRDGRRQIDFVICQEQQRICLNVDEVKRKEIDEYRKNFKKYLKTMKIEFEEDREESEKVMVTYIKLHVPFDVLCERAAELNLRVPLQISNLDERNFSSKVINFFLLPNIMKNSIPYVPEHCITVFFDMNMQEKSIGNKNDDMIFSIAQRQQVVYDILIKANTKVAAAIGFNKKTNEIKNAEGEIGIDRMVLEGIYSNAFPLHEGPYEIPSGVDDHSELNRRQLLYQYWAKWTNFFKYQPLDNIREYFGEKIALYFAWLGFYTTWLFPASLIGILLFIYAMMTLEDHIPSREICQSNMTYEMCPTCDNEANCHIWYLSSICIYSRIAYVFDNPGTVFFAIFMSVWAVIFLETWKRKNISLALRWDMLDYEKEDQIRHPQYLTYLALKRKTTGEENPTFPVIVRNQRIAIAAAYLLVMIVIVMMFVIGVIVYRILVIIPLSHNSFLRWQSIMLANTSAAIISLIMILCLESIYDEIAYKLTEWEMHETNADFEKHLIFKVTLFHTVNYYSSIFYIAFIKGNFIGYPGNYTYLFGLRNEQCSTGSCIFDLAIQLVVIMVGKQFLNDVNEIFSPKIKALYRKTRKDLDSVIQISGSDPNVIYWSKDYRLLPYGGLFEEYLEIVVQFGFITMFVAAFPLAPLFAFLNNVIEIRIDATKLVAETQRPVADRAKDIGVWEEILEFIVKLSVISNAFLIAFTSDFIPQQLYKYMRNSDLSGYVNFALSYSPVNATSTPCRYIGFRDEHGHYTLLHWQLIAIKLGFIVAFQHVVYGIVYLVKLVIPVVPEKLKIDKQRHDYIIDQYLCQTDRVSVEENEESKKLL